MKGTPAQLAAYVGKSERTIHRWLASGKLPHKRLPGGLVEVDDALIIGPEEQEGTILAVLTRMEQKLDKLAVDVVALSTSVVALSKRDIIPQPSPPAAIHPRPAVPATPIQGDLPLGLIPWRDYCDERGYAQSTVKRAIDRGEVPVHRGKWKRGKVYILAAIDEEGKAAIDRLYGK